MKKTVYSFALLALFLSIFFINVFVSISAANFSVDIEIKSLNKNVKLNSLLPPPYAYTTHDWVIMSTKKTNSIDSLSIYSYEYNSRIQINKGTSQYTSTLNIPSNFSNDKKDKILKVLHYGYKKAENTNVSSEKEDYMATQILIWLISSGHYGFALEQDIVKGLAGEDQKVINSYNRIKSRVENHNEIPNFDSPTRNVYNLERNPYDSDEFKTSIIDRKKILNKFDFIVPEGINFKVISNEVLHLSTKNKLLNPVPVTIIKKETLNSASNIRFLNSKNSKYNENLIIPIDFNDSRAVKFNIGIFTNAMGDLQINVSSEDNIVANKRYSIVGTSLHVSDFSKEVTTDENGKINLKLSEGTYSIKDLDTDYDYYYDVDFSKIVNITERTVYNYDINYKLKFSDLEVNVFPEDTDKNTFKIRVRSKEKVNNYYYDEVKELTDNKVVFENLRMGEYIVSLVDEKNIYADKEEKLIKLGEKNNIVKIYPKIKKFNLKFNLSNDTINGLDINTYKIDGISYGVYKDGKLLDEYLVSDNGGFTTKNYNFDTGYTVKQIKNNPYYIFDEEVYPLINTFDDFTKELNEINFVINKKLVSSKIRLNRRMISDDKTKLVPFENSNINIVRSDNNYIVDRVITDKNGIAISKSLPYGEYLLTESYSVDYEYDVLAKVFINKNNVFYDVSISDQLDISNKNINKKIKTDKDISNNPDITNNTSEEKYKILDKDKEQKYLYIPKDGSVKKVVSIDDAINKIVNKNENQLPTEEQNKNNSISNSEPDKKYYHVDDAIFEINKIENNNIKNLNNYSSFSLYNILIIIISILFLLLFLYRIFYVKK